MKKIAKPILQTDVLVLGSHPAAYLAAALLKHKTKLRVIHATIPNEPANDRLVTINPHFFGLHPLLSPLRRKVKSSAIYGLRFLADAPDTSSDYRPKTIGAYVAQLADIRREMTKIAREEGVEFLTPKHVTIHRLDERGLDVTAGREQIRATALVLGGALSDEQHRLLGLPEEWERGVLNRYTIATVKSPRPQNLGTKPLMPMSLDLKCKLRWAWLYPGARETQIAVEQPIETVADIPPIELLKHWAAVLTSHGVFKTAPSLDMRNHLSIDLPFGGALAHEGVANRTLLVGPAGGFYTVCAEDVYPNCWSAIHAAEVLKTALKERHLQDSIQAYRHVWRSTLGDYLRGPQQNLRFLLPLVYRNPVMANRLGEAILTGKSVVR